MIAEVMRKMAGLPWHQERYKQNNSKLLHEKRPGLFYRRVAFPFEGYMAIMKLPSRSRVRFADRLNGEFTQSEK